MYLLSETEQHVRSSVRDAILLLCQTGLKFNTELSVDGLLAVTVDKKHVFLLSVKETLQASEPCSASEGAACLYTSDNQAALNFSSDCLSAVTAEGSESVTVSRSSEEECTDSLRLNDDLQHDAESLGKSDEVVSRRRQRKQRCTVRRFLNAPCHTASPSVMSPELPSQSEHVLCWTGNENGDDGEYCKVGMLSDISDQQTAVADEGTSSDSDLCTFSNRCDLECDETVSSLRLPVEDRKQLDSDKSVIPTPLNKESVANSENIFKRSRSNQSGTVRQCLVGSTCPVTSWSTTLLESGQSNHIPRWVNSQAGETPIDIGVDNEHCKMELSDGLSHSAQTERRDLPPSVHLSAASVKAEIVEPASTSTATQLGDHNVQPSSDAEQHMALMSQFGLSAVVASMQSRFAVLPKPFPWSVRTFPSLSPPSLPTAQCGLLLGAPSSPVTKGYAKSCRYPKTPLNIPTINSYRRLNGVKSSPFLSPEVNVCANCGVTRTTVWRRLENKQILCNACGCYYKLHKVHRPLSLVRQEIRSRCRGPKMSTLMKASKSRFNGVVIAQQTPPDVALNLTTLPRKDEPK